MIFRRAAPVISSVPSLGGTSLDERWDAPAERFLSSLRARRGVELEPALELFLRRFIRQKAERYRRQLGDRAHGVDPEDVAQRVFLQLFEHPPSTTVEDRAMRRLLGWVSTVSHNYLYDLTARRAERLTARGSEPPEERESRDDEGRYAARSELARLRPRVELEYPLGVALLDLLLESPHATSQELAAALDTSAANVDQMRSRLRRVLRRQLDGRVESRTRSSR